MLLSLVSQRPPVIWRSRRPHAKHSPIGEAKATPHARSGENWWEAGADTVPLEEAKATPHARSGKSHTPRSLMLLSTKDRIRNGPQPISNLMSYSNRCCHHFLSWHHQSFLSCHQHSLARHQSLLYHESLLYEAFLQYQAFPHEPSLELAFPHVEPLLETSCVAQAAVLEPFMEASEDSALLMSRSARGTSRCILSAS